MVRPPSSHGLQAHGLADPDQSVAALITPQQCRMARAALRLTQSRLASLCDLSVLTLREFENGQQPRLHANHRRALAAVLRAAGIEIDDAGKVSLKTTKTQRGENFRFG